MCEHRIDPDNTEYAGTQDNNDGRRNAFSNATGSRDTAIHKTAEGVTESHDPDPLHTGINNSRFLWQTVTETAARKQEAVHQGSRLR